MRRRLISPAAFALASMCVIAAHWPHAAHAQRPGDGRTIVASRLMTHRPAAPPVAAPSAFDPASLVRSGRAQAVRFDLPPGAAADLATGSGVIPVDPTMTIALAVGPTYRLRVTYHTDKLDVTLFPTIRLIGYTVPPGNVDPVEFPVPIRFDARDLDDAAEGRHVSNVIYLEDPLTALPIRFPRGEMPVLDLSPGEDVIFKASALGRPIVFIQLGDRMLLDDRFEDLRNDPPVLVLAASPAPAADSGVEPAGWNGAMAAPAGAANCSPGRSSAPLCCTNQPVVRLPYKVHPRMPQDEYLCDGGDQIPHVHFDANAVLTGLAPGEAVAQFSRPGDRPRVSVANQVCVYAPRFGLLRSSLASLAGLQIEGARGVDHQMRRASMESRVAANLTAESKRVRGLRQRQRASGLLMRENPAGLEELRVLVAVHQREGSDNVFGRIGPNRMSQADELRLANSIDAARAWSREQYPAFTALTRGGGQITGYSKTGEVDMITEPDRRPGELVLTKVATPHQAQQGDTIEFAIYYHNVGERPIEGVSIIDSLTARLEYVPNSAKTDRRAVFTAAANEVDSHELRWDISDPLPGGQTGVVWFQATVR